MYACLHVCVFEKFGIGTTRHGQSFSIGNNSTYIFPPKKKNYKNNNESIVVSHFSVNCTIFFVSVWFLVCMQMDLKDECMHNYESIIGHNIM